MFSDDLRNLRVGPILKATGMNGATIRGLVALHGLRLGDRDNRDSGAPRYDLADCARLTLLFILMKNIKMPGGPAVFAVNKVYGEISEIAEAELAAIDSQSVAACPRYIMTLTGLLTEQEMAPQVMLHSSFGARLKREQPRGDLCEIVTELREVVRFARDRLASVVGVPAEALNNDFADVVDFNAADFVDGIANSMHWPADSASEHSTPPALPR